MKPVKILSAILPILLCLRSVNYFLLACNRSKKNLFDSITIRFCGTFHLLLMHSEIVNGHHSPMHVHKEVGPMVLIVTFSQKKMCIGLQLKEVLTINSE